jgi:hypothetical protein
VWVDGEDGCWLLGNPSAEVLLFYWQRVKLTESFTSTSLSSKRPVAFIAVATCYGTFNFIFFTVVTPLQPFVIIIENTSQLVCLVGALTI